MVRTVPLWCACSAIVISCITCRHFGTVSSVCHLFVTSGDVPPTMECGGVDEPSLSGSNIIIGITQSPAYGSCVCLPT